MKITKGEMTVFAIALAAFLVGACFYPYLPERMASHWNAKGQVDGYMSKGWGTFLMPITIAGLGLLFMVIVRIDPLKANIAGFRKYYDGFIILFAVFLFCLNLWMLLWNIGYKFSLNIVMPIGVGLLVFYLGILCENAKRNWFIGIRTPWTLSSDIVWDKTHKIGAKLFKAMGIVILAGVFWPAYLLFFILIPTVLVTVFLLAYSYVVYQKVGQVGESARRLNNESGDGTWESVKAGYLKQVEKALSSAGRRETKQVLEDVNSHLDQRFSELGPEEQTWENMQAIITEMGPASDYAELLEPEVSAVRQPAGRKTTFLMGIFISVTTVILIVIVSVMVVSNKQEVYELREVSNIENLSHPFENDPEVIGYWKSVDFVDAVEDFDPGKKKWRGELFLKDFSFMANGGTSFPWTWTKDWIWHNDGRTKAQYQIKQMGNETYLFLPWLSGDVTIRHQKPSYYVLKKQTSETPQIEPTPVIQWLELTEKSAADNDGKVNAAVDAAKDWLKITDDGDYATSWEQTCGLFKSKFSKEQLVQSFDLVRAPLSKVISRKVISTQYTDVMPGVGPGEYVIIQFKTSFENKADAIETVTPMLDKDGVWRVSGYYINIDSESQIPRVR